MGRDGKAEVLMRRFRGPAAACVLVFSLASGAAWAKTPACDRACLGGLLDQYVTAFESGQPSAVPFSAHARVTENGVAKRPGEGAWKTATGVGSYRLTAIDEATGQAAFIGVLKEGGKSTLFALRLKANGTRIGEAETVIARVGLSGKDGDAAGSLNLARSAFSQVLAGPDRPSRASALAAANSYYEGIKRGSGSIVAFANDCHRIENGVALVNNPDFHFALISPTGRPLPNFAAMGCREQFDTGLWSTDSVANKRFPVVDTRTGVVVAFTRYQAFARSRCAQVKGVGAVCPAQATQPFDLDLVEWFRIKGGKIHEMESVWTVLPQGQGVGW